MEQCYGGNKLAYAVTDRRLTVQGHILVFVFHNNNDVREALENRSPSQLLRRRDAFTRSETSAENWLAQVMRDYESHFERDLLQFEFIWPVQGESPY